VWKRPCSGSASGDDRDSGASPDPVFLLGSVGVVTIKSML